MPYRVDYCWKYLLEILLLEQGQRKRRRSSRLSMSEMITLMMHFHQSHYRNFKAYYLEYVGKHFIIHFPHLLNYSRFVELILSIVIPLAAYLKKHDGNCSGIAYIDSTKLPMCHPKRMHRNHVFKRRATMGKSTMGLGQHWKSAARAEVDDGDVAVGEVGEHRLAALLLDREPVAVQAHLADSDARG